jgi:hypothetical protein
VIADPAPNTITRPYRGLSVQDVDVPLTETDLLGFLLGREVYRRTDYLALRRGRDTALVALRKQSLVPLFSPVVEARLLAGPDEVTWIDSPETDVGNATALANAAELHGGARARAYIVHGRFEHVNFIWEPAPVPIRVTEVVPPAPPKLLAMAEQAVAFDEDLPPIRLVLDAVDIEAVARDNPAQRYLLPCRGAGTQLGAEVAFLDTRPPQQDWLMVGCERSLQLHRHFYGAEPERVDICPRQRVASTNAGGLTLAKCCLLERGIEVEGDSAVVPWGANLDEVRTALRRLTGVELRDEAVIG